MQSSLRSTHWSVVLLSATSSTNITQALLRNAESQAPPQTCWIRICVNELLRWFSAHDSVYNGDFFFFFSFQLERYWLGAWTSDMCLGEGWRGQFGRIWDLSSTTPFRKGVCKTIGWRPRDKVEKWADPSLAVRPGNSPAWSHSSWEDSGTETGSIFLVYVLLEWAHGAPFWLLAQSLRFLWVLSVFIYLFKLRLTLGRKECGVER